VHEELGRHDIQSLADVLANAGHRLAAVRRRTAGVRGFVRVVNAAQVRGQGLTARLLTRRPGCGRCLGQCRLKRGELGLEVGLVLQQRVLEHLPLLGRHRLALGAELPALQARQLEGDLLDLGVAERDVAILALQLLLLGLEVSLALLDMPEDLRDQRRGGLLRQTLQVRRLEVTHAEHAPHLAKSRDLMPLADVLSTHGHPRHHELTSA